MSLFTLWNTSFQKLHWLKAQKNVSAIDKPIRPATNSSFNTSNSTIYCFCFYGSFFHCNLGFKYLHFTETPTIELTEANRYAILSCSKQLLDDAVYLFCDKERYIHGSYVHRKIHCCNNRNKTSAENAFFAQEIAANAYRNWATPIWYLSIWGLITKKILRLSYDVIITYDNRKSNLR